LLSGAWNTLCCIPATVDDTHSDTSDQQQQQPLLDTAAVQSSLYTENQQQVPACDIGFP